MLNEVQPDLLFDLSIGAGPRPEQFEADAMDAEVAADLRTLYTIEYAPTNLARDGKWREIRVEVNEPGLISRTRQGYFAR